MEIIALLKLVTGFLSSSAGGGIIGFLLQKMKDKDNLDQDYRMAELHLKEMDKEKELLVLKSNMERQTQTALIRAEAEGKNELAAIEAEKTETVAEYAAIEASYEHDKASYIDKAKGRFSQIIFTLVDASRGFMRPTLTAATWGLVAYVLIILSKTVIPLIEAGSIPPQEALELLTTIVTEVLFLAGVFGGWWFASRPKRGGGR